MDIWVLGVGFGLGFVANLVRLPPMVGYLLAGFALRFLGQESTQLIEVLSEVGILLLLFGIGLKLKVKTLARPMVWAGASIHMAVTVCLVAGAVFVGGRLGIHPVGEMSIVEATVIAFALSFSSTVFAVKALQERNEGSSVQGRNAIGILVVQDLFAVIFLTLAVDDLPSIWAVPVIGAVLLARPLYGWVLDRVAHGELVLLLALILALGVGSEAFGAVGLKADLGALLVGVSLATHVRADELADSILDLKDVLLVGFFMSIGLDGSPGLTELLTAAALLAILPVKTFGFMALSCRFGYRLQTSWQTAISLGTFSEFGLIVAVIGVERGMIDGRWSTILGLAVAGSFLLAALVNSASYSIFDRYAHRFTRLETDEPNIEDSLVDHGPADVLIFGMGRVGTGAYDELVARHALKVLGVDRSDERALRLAAAGRNVVRGDALDGEFWVRASLDPELRLVLLAMNEHSANVAAIDRLRRFLPSVPIAAIARHPDEVDELSDLDVQVARNLYEEAGQGLADDACLVLGLDNGDS